MVKPSVNDLTSCLELCKSSKEPLWFVPCDDGKNNTPAANRTVQRFTQGGYPAHPRRPVSPTGVSHQLGGIPTSLSSPSQNLLFVSLMLRRLEGYTQIYYTLVMKGCQEKILLSYVESRVLHNSWKSTQSGFLSH